MSRIFAALLCSCLTLAGCTAVSTKMTSADTAMISASDDEASLKEAHEAALVAAAKMARQRGYQYFSVLSARDTDGTEWHYIPAGPIGSGNVGSAGGIITQAGQDIMVRFLRASQLPSDRRDIYFVAMVLSGR